MNMINPGTFAKEVNKMYEPNGTDPVVFPDEKNFDSEKLFSIAIPQEAQNINLRLPNPHETPGKKFPTHDRTTARDWE